jgi:acyl-CoA synthetase (NDP forming)
MDWEKLFQPRSIAVIGASTKTGLTINNFFSSLVKAQFPGILYPVNHHADEVMGYPAFRSLRDIPGPVDYAVIAVPRDSVIESIKDCISKKVAAVHIFTSGFGETNTSEGRKLNQELKNLISGKLRVIGPNCMGIYCPGSRMVYLAEQSLMAGDIGFISQSGGHASLFIETATSQGLYFSKSISLGNALDLGINDFLEHFGEDSEIQIIGVYVEGMQEGQGRRFLELVRKISPKKPVMIMKAGRDESGARAAASHTGSMAGSYSIWENMARQANAVIVNDYTEMADFIWAYKCLDQVPGLRAGVVSGGGGNSVWCGDIFSSLGLTLPPLTPQTQNKLLELTDLVGTIAQNPVDPNMSALDPEVHARVFEMLDAQPDIDILINIAVFDFWYNMVITKKLFTREQVIEEMEQRLEMIRQRVKKPFVTVAFHVSENADMTAILNQMRHKVRKQGVPCYTSLERMAAAVCRLYDYYRRRDGAQINS